MRRRRVNWGLLKTFGDKPSSSVPSLNLQNFRSSQFLFPVMMNQRAMDELILSFGRCKLKSALFLKAFYLFLLKLETFSFFLKTISLPFH